MRFPFVLVALVLALVLGGSFYAARAPERTRVPTIELRAEQRDGERRQERRERSQRVTKRSGGDNDGAGGGAGATVAPAPPPSPVGVDDDDEDDDDRDDASDDGAGDET